MKKLILVALVVFCGMKAYEHFQPNFAHAQNDSSLSTLVGGNNTQPKMISASFTCDGRTHCSQMTSCEEATFFLKNCPNTKMDGNHDGVPCEQQWCR
ncbi:excalibur calcium-binding domain-containing protein [Uliginosibacterium sp. 31-12]|uniref:excalibur calcium-binding domain-containing protein n=1 Tax=Uliginosibacterium sp. 31-12 TaxID=3062781 RepID=UPI0026E26D0D|nr:excalibur calcium-binding domain-containing protein [Uliginosibacterium sp. 31-12]MDO6388451.1 excalibur calcium-binding domain-containing protein [Uliginosibacterium sp. 31-12]